MSGFPNRPQRIAFGPQMRNKRDPVIPETDLSADQVNLMLWQVAGAGRTLPMALILFDGATGLFISQAYAFDPRQELTDPVTVVDNGTGDYTFTFASTYPNQSGQATPFVPLFSMSMVQGAATGVKSNTSVVSGQSLDVIVRDVAESPIDATFVLAVW